MSNGDEPAHAAADGPPRQTIRNSHLARRLDVSTHPIFVYPVPLSMTSGGRRDMLVDVEDERRRELS